MTTLYEHHALVRRIEELETLLRASEHRFALQRSDRDYWKLEAHRRLRGQQVLAVCVLALVAVLLGIALMR